MALLLVAVIAISLSWHNKSGQFDDMDGTASDNGEISCE